MTTLTLKINERTKAGKAFLALTQNLVKDTKSIAILSSKNPEKLNKKESPYNPEFVKMILDRYKKLDKTKLTQLNPDDIWGSIL
jgi:hypothetical protein